MKTPQGVLTRIKEGAAGYLSQSDPRLLFGLDGGAGVEWIEVRWPSGQVQRFAGVASGTSVLLVEGEAQLRTVREQRFELPDPRRRQEHRWDRVALSPGAPLPALEVLSLSGESFDLSALAEEGTTTLLNFWATWCSTCQREVPELEALHRTGRVRVLGISVDEPEAREKVVSFVRDKGMTYDVYMADLDAVANSIFAGDVSIPLSVFTDEQGNVVDVFPFRSIETEQRWAELLDGAE